MIPEEVFEWIKKESKTPEMLTQFAIDFLSQYVKFCQEDHKDIILNKGRNPKKNTLNKENYLHKLHNNSITVNIPRARQFMSQVGGIPFLLIIDKLVNTLCNLDSKLIENSCRRRE